VVAAFYIPIQEGIGMQKGREGETESLFNALQSEEDLQSRPALQGAG